MRTDLLCRLVSCDCYFLYLSKLTIESYKSEQTNNCYIKQMLKTAKEFARKDHELSHSCIVVVLTHGHLNTLLGTDGSLVDIGQFIRYFQEAPSLIGKPKIFIFQACRGGKRARERLPNVVFTFSLDRRDYGVLHEVSDGALSWIRKFLSDRPVWISDQTKHIEKVEFLMGDGLPYV